MGSTRSWSEVEGNGMSSMRRAAQKDSRGARPRRPNGPRSADTTPTADATAERVYAFESEWVHWTQRRCSLDTCRRWIRTACAHFAVEAVPVHKSKGPMAFSSGSGVWLPDWAHNEMTALHEAAHVILARRDVRCADHGPTWLGVYFWLIERCGWYPMVAIHACARKHHLRWRNVSPDTLPDNRHH
jgi:hypothetical protein